MRWSPLVVAAGGLVVGIILAAAVNPPATLLIGLFAVTILIAGVLEFLGRDSYRAVLVLALFVTVGALLLGLSANPPTSTPPVNKTEINSSYKTIASGAIDALGEAQGGLLLAIVFGDQTGVAAAVKDDFRRSGLLHLFAASGFNVTLAAGFIMLLARAAKLPKLLAALLALVSIGFYFHLVGPTPSVLRATVMSTVLYLALFFGRRIDALASTSAAVIILLAIDPSGLFNIGWQLSFAGLLGILVLAPKINDYIKPEASRLAAPLVVTAGAQTAVAPFLVYHFGQISTVALVTNPVVTAAVAYVTGLGFAGSIITLFWSAGGRAILSSLAEPLRFVQGAARIFASMPAATLQVQPSVLNTIALLAAIGLIAVVLIKRRILLGVPGIIILILALQATGVWLDLTAGIQQAALTANFLDIGQGDATLIKSKKGAIVLIDGGRDYERLDRELRQRGVRHIDLLILSHAHADHVGSLDELMDKYPVAMVIEPGYRYATKSYSDFKRAVAKHRIPFSLARAGRSFRINDIRIDILWPQRPLMAGTESDINNNSIVAKLKYNQFNLLLTGDIQEEAIGELLRRRVNLKAQVLKVSHQGSANGTTNRLLASIKPKYAVISVGRGNPYGHPHQPTLERLKRFTRRIARTDNDGDVTISTDGRGINFSTDR